MSVPAHGMRVGQPANEGGQLAVLSRPQHQVPVVGHDTIGKEPGRMLLQGQGQNAFERFIIAVLLKERQTRHGSIKDVIDETTRGNAGFARHGPKLAREGAVVNEKELRPLFLFAYRPSTSGGNVVIDIEFVSVPQI